ncbi:MAG TPA: ATP-binding protein [Puia sp.]|nr:ATP-binding protein [Puia sp.]
MRCWLFTGLLFFTQTTGHGQMPADSVLIRQAQSAFDLANSAPDSAYSIADKILQQSLPAGRLRVSAFASRAKGWALMRLGNYDSCMPYLLSSADLFRRLNDTVETMYMYANLASAYSANSRFAESAVYLMRADSLAKGRNDTRIAAGIQKQMGILYRQQKYYDKAIPYFKESMRLYMSVKDTLHFLDVITSLSINYNTMSLPDSSLALLEDNMPVMKKFRGSTYLQAMLKERFGDTYLALNNYSKALEAYKQAYGLFAADNNHADQAYESMNVGRTYMLLKDYHHAEPYLKEAYRLNDSLQLVSYARDAAEQLSDLYDSTHNWQKAYQWMQTAYILYDSLRFTDQNEKVAELQTRYETAKKDNEISLLKKDKELDRAILQKQKIFRYGAVAVLTLLALLGALAINRYRVIQRARRQIEMEKLRNDIASDLHDDMGSVLSSINVMSKVALHGPPGKEGLVKDNLKKIHENSNYILESMSDIVWAINPVNDSFEKTLFRMKEFAGDILEPLGVQYEFKLSEGLYSLSMGLKKRKDFFLFFKEAVNNAAKYSRCTKVRIDIAWQNDFIALQVEDNGIGFNAAKEYLGNGLRNMKQRAEQMNGEYTISSEPGKGALIFLKMKIT